MILETLIFFRSCFNCILFNTDWCLHHTLLIQPENKNIKLSRVRPFDFFQMYYIYEIQKYTTRNIDTVTRSNLNTHMYIILGNHTARTYMYLLNKEV